MPAIRDEVERINAERGDLHLTIFADQSEFIQQSIRSVRQSALWGSLLAILVLYLVIMFVEGQAYTLTQYLMPPVFVP